jgi:hypothetical protein
MRVIGSAVLFGIQYLFARKFRQPELKFILLVTVDRHKSETSKVVPTNNLWRDFRSIRTILQALDVSESSCGADLVGSIIKAPLAMPAEVSE